MSKRSTNQLALATLVFLITQMVLTLVLNFSESRYTEVGTWSRWDSYHYLAIAEKGYEFFPCAGKFGYPLDATEMCGNTGWFPGYPMLIRQLSYFSSDTALIGVLVAKSFYFLSLLMVLLIAKLEDFSIKSIVLLMIPAFCFGFIYYNAVFPISTVLFFSLLGFHLFLRKRMWLAGLCCALVSFLYPTGFLLSMAFAITYILRPENGKWDKRFIRSLIPLFLGATGTLMAFLVYHLQVEDWTAFIQVQSKYGHGAHNPIKSIGNMLKRVSSDLFYIENTIILQSVLVIGGYLVLTVFFVSKKLYCTELYLLTFCYVSMFFLFPWIVGGNLSMYRAESLLFPFVFLLKDLKLPWTISLLSILVAVGMIMSHLFFTKVLV